MSTIIIDDDDPLDSKGKYNNFLTNKEYSKEYKELATKWSNLPLYQSKSQIKKLFDLFTKNQIILVISGTGSGKTVLIPKFLLKYFFMINKPLIEKDDKLKKNYNSVVIVTNPKILSTQENALYNAKTLDVKIGEEVGYKYKGVDNMVSSKTKLIYATDGIILAQLLKGDKLLSNIQGLIIDEIHERQVPIDILLYLIKYIVLHRPEFKIIIMSATVNADIFKKFYEKDNIKFDSISISGQSNYPITSYYMQPGDKINFYNFMDVGIAFIFKILTESTTGDILMFVTTQRETEIGCNKFKKLCPNNKTISDKCNTYYCIEVYGKMTDDSRQLAISKDLYKKSNNYKRKIIFTTNVAESSLTIEGIVYIIDCGLELISYFDYIKYCNVLEKQFITKAQIKQRMGRAGRTQPGICYHLYTEDKYNKLLEYPKPSIVLTNMNDYILSFFGTHIYLSSVLKLCISLLTPLSPLQFLSSIRYLHFYNLIKIIDIERQSSQAGGNIHTNDIKFLNDDETDNLYELNKLNYKSIPYKNLQKYEYWNKYEGCLTGLGKISNLMQGFPIEIRLLTFYGKLLNLPMLYTIASIIYVMDNKIENLIKFPHNLQHDEKIQFINTNFPQACVYYYSEHLFVYNLMIYYYETNLNTNLLNISFFEKAEIYRNNISLIIDKIPDNYIDDITNKYSLLPVNLEAIKFTLLEKLYLALYLSYKFNTIKLIDINTKSIYQTQYYLENNSSEIKFNYGMQLNNNDANNYSWGICSSIVFIMNKLSFNQCTLLPNTLTVKFNDYIIYS